MKIIIVGASGTMGTTCQVFWKKSMKLCRLTERAG